jgi:thioester reductase-like protein/non-ribosomal peptide synthase protein (TIGR01720 family)
MDTPVPMPSATVADWVRHLEHNQPRLQQDLAFWHGQQVDDGVPVSRDEEGSNDEEWSRTVWFALSREETTRLEKDPELKGLHATLFGAFAHVVSKSYAIDKLRFEFESHGRATFDQEIDISRLVGWFTSSFPLTLTLDNQVQTCIRNARELLASVPNLGLAFGAFDERALAGEQPQICYNYLGRFAFNTGHGLALRPSRFRIGAARGPANARVHDWKLTARVLDGELIVDLSYSRRCYETERMRGIAREVRTALRELAHSSTGDCEDVVVEDGSSSGLLLYCPAKLRAPKSLVTKVHRNIFVTGATGYLGCYLLHGLLERSKATIYCLVRKGGAVSAWRRLCESYAWSFGSLEIYRDRIVVLEGDLAEKDFGLEPATFRHLTREVDAIYHFGADTRLFGEDAAIERQNLRSVESSIALSTLGKPKELHYMSTLAVSGVVSTSDSVVFHEHCLDVQQTFLNSYERSKYAAEIHVRDFIRTGGLGFIYRAGNVSGHSETGRFQRNADANRFVQLVRAVVRVGKVPRAARERITLTPVDLVMDAVLTISLEKSEGGVFHVDGTHSTSFEEVFDCLTELGCNFETVEEDTVRDVLRLHGDQADPVVALGSFWANREERNVTYDHSFTHRMLRSLGVEFRAMGRDWLKLFLGELIRRGVVSGDSPRELISAREQAARGNAQRTMTIST